MSVTQEQLDKIRELYGETAYNQYLTAENAVKGKEHLPKIEREYLIGQAYGNPNARTKEQHRSIANIIEGKEATQEEINTIADEALKQII